MADSPTRPRVVSLADAARHRGVSTDTIRNYIKRGYFRAFTVTGRRGLLVDIDEMDRSLAKQPPSRVRRGYGSYGSKARIVALDPKTAAARLPRLDDEQATTVAALLRGSEARR